MARERISWDELFMEMAYILAKRSSCLNTHIGAVLVTPDNDVISTGYNGSPAKLPNCSDLGYCRRKQEAEYESGKDLHLCNAVHAEANAILLAAKNGHGTKGAKLYCTHQPCKECAKQIVNAGIEEVIYSEVYPNNKESIEIMQGAEVRVKHRPLNG
ncbi:MAG: dCMP deaminase family protein [Peptococcaceae bacterium]|nr:dCMP deaminase family protein [Peptococcaceae bacterium]